MEYAEVILECSNDNVSHCAPGGKQTCKDGHLTHILKSVRKLAFVEYFSFSYECTVLLSAIVFFTK